MFQVGYSDEEAELYNTYFAVRDPYVRRIRNRFPGQLAIGTTSDLFTEDELQKSAYFAEYGRKFGVFHITWLILENGGSHGSGLSLLRGIEAEPFEPETTKLLCALAPHLRRALGVQRRMAQLSAEIESGRYALNVFGIAMVALDNQRRIVACTRAAENFLKPEHGLKRSGRCIEAVEPSANSALQAALSGAIATSEGRGLELAIDVEVSGCHGKKKAWTAPSGGTICITRRYSKTPLRIFYRAVLRLRFSVGRGG